VCSSTFRQDQKCWIPHTRFFQTYLWTKEQVAPAMNMSSDGMSTMSLSVAGDLFLYAAVPNYFLNNFLHLRTRCLQGMHLVRAIALDSNPPLNVWSVFTYWYCKSYYQYCLTKIRSSLYFTKQLEEDGRQRGEKLKGPRNMSYGVSFLLWVTHSYGVSFEICKWAMWHCKELVSAMVFLDLWAGFWQEKLRHYRDRRYPKPNFLLQQYTSLFVRNEEKWWEKEKNQVDINLWGNEGYGDCSTVVTWVAISESANVSFSEQPQLLLLLQSKNVADVKALCCG
jgi:hypothetical protein